MLAGTKLLLALAALAPFNFTFTARGDQTSFQRPDSCVDDCEALRCNADGSSATPTIVEGTTIIAAPATGPSPYTTPPYGLPGNAQQAGSFVGPDGETTVSWKIVEPSTVFVPGSTPTEPPCASWTVTKIPKTDVVNGQTIIREDPVLSAVGPKPSTTTETSTTTATSTSTSTETTTTTSTTTWVLPITTTSTETSTTTETTTTTTTSIPPPVTTTTTSTSTTTETTTTTTTSIPPPILFTDTTTRTETSTTTTTSVPPPVTSTTTSTTTETSTTTSTTIWITTSTSIPPPVTSTTTESRTTTLTTTSTATSTSTTTSTYTTTSTTIFIPPPVTTTTTSTSTTTQTSTTTSTATATSTYTTTSTTTSTATSTSISTYTTTSTTTSIPPPVTTTTTSTSTSTYTTTSLATSTAWFTTTWTSTTSISYCPPPTPPATPCVPGITTQWENADIYKGRPFTLSWNDPYPALLKLQDAGYKTEKYSIQVDGGTIGTTPDIANDRGAWCGLSPLAQKTCYAQGLAYGEFNIPNGQHSVTITNIPGIYDDKVASYSTVFYQVERRCPNQYIPPPSPCSPDVQQGWTNIDVYEGRNYNLATFNYNFPVKLSVVDAGYKTEKYYVIVDGVQIGLTHDYQTNWLVWCGITADQAQNCLNQGMSSGVFVIPAGSHSVAFSSISTRNPVWAAYSTLFYKIEKYCA